MVWLPKERVLFAGDMLIEDGVTMVVDGSVARARCEAWPGSTACAPGRGARPRRPPGGPRGAGGADPGLHHRPRSADMRAAVEQGVPMQRALATLPPPDENRPVSLNSRRRRNAARVYVEEERAYMGLEDSLP